MDVSQSTYTANHAANPSDGDGVTGDIAALDTSIVGTHTFNVESWDFNGNDTVTTVSYVVVARTVVLGFTGETAPIGIGVLALLLLGGGAIALLLTRRRTASQQ